MAMGESLSGRAFAVLDGSSPAAVRKARDAGHIVADAQGRYDPRHARNRAWLKREKQTERRAAKLPEARLQAASARLATLEFEVEVRRGFYVPREPLALWLHRIADALQGGAAGLPRAVDGATAVAGRGRARGLRGDPARGDGAAARG